MVSQFSVKRFGLYLGAVACSLSVAGCGPASLLYLLFLMPRPKLPAKFDKLEKKTVVVAPYAASGAQFEFAAVDREVGRRVVRQLRDNVVGIRIADPNQVAVWCDAHADFDWASLGKEFKADYVLVLDIEKFTLFETNSVQLLRGQSHVHIQVADVSANGDVIWETYLESSFPGSRPVPAGEMSREKFRQLYLERLGREISRNFHPYNTEESFTIE